MACILVPANMLKSSTLRCMMLNRKGVVIDRQWSQEEDCITDWSPNLISGPNATSYSKETWLDSSLVMWKLVVQ
jgi:hypothetical protein